MNDLLEWFIDVALPCFETKLTHLNSKIRRGMDTRQDVVDFCRI